MKRNETFFTIMVLLGAMLWGTTGTAQHFAPEGASPLSIGAVRLAVGGVALILFAFSRGAVKGRDIWISRDTFVAALSVAAYQLFFFAAVLMTGVAMGTVVALGSAPVFAGLISALINRENPGRKWIISTIVSVIGCFLLVTGGEKLSLNINGILLALGAGASYATYTASSKDLLDRYSPEAVTGVVFFIGAVLLSPFLIFYNLDWLKSIQGVGVALHLGLLATALAYILFSYGLSGIQLHKAVTLSLAEPATASALGIFLLKEKLTIVSSIGMILVLSGIIILSSVKSIEREK